MLSGASAIGSELAFAFGKPSLRSSQASEKAIMGSLVKIKRKLAAIEKACISI